MTLIEELYSPNAVELIRDLYYDSPESKESFYQAFGNKILENPHKVLLSKPLDILMLICSTANFATSHQECQDVAVMIYKRLQEKNPLPYVLDDHGLDLAEKSLIALSFFKPAMIIRWKKGAPSLDFYRNYSKNIFKSSGYEDLSEHHEKWESFLSEFFI